MINAPIRCALWTTAAATLFSASLEAQFQASNRTARRTSIQANPASYTPTSPTAGDALLDFGIQGPPGAFFSTVLELPATVDTAFQVGGATPGTRPFCVDLANPALILLTAPGSSGFMPANGSSSVNFVFPGTTSAFLGLRVRFQTYLFDALTVTGVSTSNCGDKILTDISALDTSFATPFNAPVNSVSPSGDYIDVERGDFDGDGDIDTLLLERPGRIVGILDTGGGPVAQMSVFDLSNISPPPPPVIGIPGATSMELADVNNDNYLDLVLSIGDDSFVSVHLNRGRTSVGVVNPVTGAVTFNQTLLGWLGFDSMPVTVALQNGPGFENLNINAPLSFLVGEDVETADFDQDGDLDLVVATSDDVAPGPGFPGGAVLGAPNRIFTNLLVETGTATFQETTVPDPGLPNAPSLFPSVNLDELIYDDSEDVEVGFLDEGDRYDIAFANVIGPAPIEGFEFVFFNTAPVMTSREIIPGASVNDQSLDLALGDLNGDGIDDIYVGNWFQGPGGFFTTTPLADQVYFSTGPGAWFNNSGALPDTFDPTNPPNEPRATSDVEIANVFSTDSFGLASPLPEVVLGYGRRGSSFGAAGPLASGVRVLQFDAGVIGNYVLLDPMLDAVDVGDLETGDWSREFFDLDFGIALDNSSGSLSAFFSGHAIVTR